LARARVPSEQRNCRFCPRPPSTPGRSPLSREAVRSRFPHSRPPNSQKSCSLSCSCSSSKRARELQLLSASKPWTEPVELGSLPLKRDSSTSTITITSTILREVGLLRKRLDLRSVRQEGTGQYPPRAADRVRSICHMTYLSIILRPGS
jgi:hypothetical protein